MGLFRKLFGGSKEPEKPDDYYLASAIASTIDGFISIHGLTTLLDGDWSVALGKDYSVSLTQMDVCDDARSVVRLNELGEMAFFKRVQSDSLMSSSQVGYFATDQLAMAVLRRIKEQVG